MYGKKGFTFFIYNFIYGWCVLPTKLAIIEMWRFQHSYKNISYHRLLYCHFLRHNLLILNLFLEFAQEYVHHCVWYTGLIKINWFRFNVSKRDEDIKHDAKRDKVFSIDFLPYYFIKTLISALLFIIWWIRTEVSSVIFFPSNRTAFDSSSHWIVSY